MENEPRLGKRKKVFVLLDDGDENEEEETRRNGMERQKSDYERVKEEPLTIHKEERQKKKRL